MLVFQKRKIDTGCNAYFRFTRITEHPLVPCRRSDKHFNIYSQLHTGVNQENSPAQTTLTKSVQQNKRSPLLFRASLFSTGLLPRTSIREREKEKHERERSRGGGCYTANPKRHFHGCPLVARPTPNSAWTSIFSLCNAEDNLDSHSIMSSL